MRQSVQSTISIMASQWISSHQHRGIHVMCFPYFVSNWGSRQSGCIYVCQHPHNAQLSVEKLRGIANRVLPEQGSNGSSSEVDSLPTIFFTHSAADLQFPELSRLICPDDPDSSSVRHTLTDRDRDRHSILLDRCYARQ